MFARFLARTLLITWILMTLGPVHGALAAVPTPGYPKGGTVLIVEPLKPFDVGDQPSITVHLTTIGGAPLANQLIRVFNYGNQWRTRTTQSLTDGSGTARIPIPFYFRPGSYPILVAFDGSAPDRLNPSSSGATLTIVPGTVQVQTVPPLSGVPFSLNGEIHMTDSNGVVAFRVDHVGGYQIQAVSQVLETDSDVKVAFDRWDNSVTNPNRQFQYPAKKVLQAAFQLSYLVNLKYTDVANRAVDPARISLTRVRGAGTAYTMTQPGPVWLPGNYIRQAVGGPLQNFPATYYLDAVNIGGSNVVDPGQQVYQAGPGSTWPIHLFLYSASFTAHDAIFRFPLGSGILLQYPDGARQVLSFDQSSGVIQIDALPRGSYHASVEGVQGLQPPTSFDLSQTQQLNLVVISRLDMAIMLGGPALVILFLLVMAMRSPFASLRLRRRASSSPRVS